MYIEGYQYRELSNALLSAFSPIELRQMVRIGLDENLDRISGGENFKSQVFELIKWADAHDRLLDLVRSAHEFDPDNTELSRLFDSWIASQSTTSTAAETAASVGVTRVFISYSSEDGEELSVLIAELEAQDIAVSTTAGLEPGTGDWQFAIESMLRDAEVVVVLLSPEAKRSTWVNVEIELAKRFGCRIIPVLIRGTEASSIPISLTSIQYLDARKDYLKTVSNRLIPDIMIYLKMAQ